MTERSLHPILSRPLQARFLTIPQATNGDPPCRERPLPMVSREDG
jgi:hypothetical protein